MDVPAKKILKKRVAVAMSGGVDSSAAAGLLVRQGYDVIGTSMKLSDSGEVDETGCRGIHGVEVAGSVAQKIGIPFHALNYEEEFKKKLLIISAGNMQAAVRLIPVLSAI